MRGNGRVKADLFFTFYPSVLFDFFFFYYEHVSLLLKKKEASCITLLSVLLLLLVLFFSLLYFHFETFSQRMTQFIKKNPRTIKQQKD